MVERDKWSWHWQGLDPSLIFTQLYKATQTASSYLQCHIWLMLDHWLQEPEESFNVAGRPCTKSNFSSVLFSDLLAAVYFSIHKDQQKTVIYRNICFLDFSQFMGFLCLFIIFRENICMFPTSFGHYCQSREQIWFKVSRLSQASLNKSFLWASLKPIFKTCIVWMQNYCNLIYKMSLKLTLVDYNTTTMWLVAKQI